MKVRKNTVFPAPKSLRKAPKAVEVLESRIAPAAALGVTKVAVFAPGGDLNNDGNFDPGDTMLYTVTLTNNGDVDLTGVSFNDILDANLTQGAVNVSPLAIDDIFSTPGNTLLEVGVVHGTSPAAIVAGGVFSNDTDFLGDTFTLSSFETASASGGTVAMNANGSFTYLPAAGFSGTDTFHYTITDKGLDGLSGTPATDADNLTSIGTVTVTVGQKVWYVDNSYTGANGVSDGRSTRPFTTLSPLSTGGSADSLDGANDIIFVHSGTGTTAGTIVLEANQTLHGQGDALTVAGFNLVAAGTAPTLAPGTGTAVMLATGNTLKGFIIGNAGIDIAGTGFGTLTVSNVTLNGTGKTLDLVNGTFAAASAFNSIASTSTTAGQHGLKLDNVAGTVNFGSTTISGSSAQAVFLTNSTVNVTFGNTAIGTATANSGSGAGSEGIRFESNSTGTHTFGTLTIQNTQGRGFLITGDTGGSTTVNGVANISATASDAIFVQNSVESVTFNTTLTITNPTGDGISLNAHTGMFTALAPSSSITNAGGTDVKIVGGNGTLTFAGTITDDVGALISISGATGGTKTFSGAITDGNDGDGSGISLTNNTGATIDFTGGITLSTSANPAFTATGGGTVSVTQTNTITTTTGTALNVTNTTIGASGLTFRSISANGASKAIILNNTGTGAGLTITGTGTTDGSGGTIQNISQRGIELINTAKVSLKNLTLTNANTTDSSTPLVDLSSAAGLINAEQANGAITMSGVNTITLDNIDINGTAQMGIAGRTVTNFTLKNSTITNAGDGVAGAGGTMVESGVWIYNMAGTGLIDNTDISFSQTKAVNIVNRDTNLNFTLSNSTLRDTQTNVIGGAANSLGEDGFQFQSYSDAAGAPTVNVDVINNQLLRLRTQALQIFSADDSVMSVDITGNTIDCQAGIGSPDPTIHIGTGIDLNTNNTASMVFNVIGNSLIRSRGGSAVNITAFGDSDIEGRVNDNTNISANGTGAGGTGVRVLSQEGNTTAIVEVRNNNITMGTGNNSSAIDAQARFNNARLDLTLDNNNLNSETTAVADINITAGSSAGVGSGGPETNQVFVDIKNNDVAAGGPTNILRLRVSDLDGSSDPRIFLTGFVEGGTGLDDDAVATWNAKGNTPQATTANVNVSLTGTATAPSSGTALVPDNPQPLFFAPTADDVVIVPVNEDGETVLPPVVVDQPSVVEVIDNNPTVVQPPVIVDDGILSQAELDSLVAAAIARWDAAGISPEQSALLRTITFSIEDMPGWYLGSAAPGHITLDLNAAGNSWFIDPTPNDDSEFSGTGTQLFATSSGGAAGRIDALSTLVHELGHQLGLEDTYASSEAGNLMYGLIHQGERRLPAMDQADGATPHAVSGGLDFAIGPVNIGSLPVGKSVKVVFTAQINNNIAVNQVSNQGTASSTQTGNVLSDDPAVAGAANPTVTAVDLPDVSLTVSAPAIAEDGASTLTYTFTRTGPNDFSRTVNFAATGTASALSDYTLTSGGTFTFDTATGLGTVTFAPGSSTLTLTFNATDDTLVEANETAILTVTSGTGYDVGSPNAATGTITNDDTDISVSVAPASVTEDGAGNLVYTFTRTGVTTGAHTANFSVTGSPTFTSGDYSILAAAGITFTPGTGLGTVAFAAGETTKTVTLDPAADSTVEGDETATVNVLAGTGYNIGAPGSASGTITNDDSDVTLSVSPASVAEDGPPNLVYTFTRTGFITNALTVNFTVGGAATFGTDYDQTGAASFSATTGTITFAAGSNTATLTLDPTADAVVEGDETTALTLASGTGYNVATAGAVTGTITNDDTDVTLAVSPASTNEDGSSTLLYTFTRTGVTTGALTVNFSVGGNATFGTDYTQTGAATFAPTTGTVTFAAGSNTATVTLSPTDDTTVEANETALLTVTAGTGYNIATPSAATGTILNDDTDITVAVAPGSVTEDGASNLVYTFTRAGVTTGSHIVNFSVTGSPTLTSADYAILAAAGITFTPGTGLGAVTFAAGETTKTVTLDPTADSTVEADETATVNVLAGTGYNIGAQATASGAITNDDSDVTLSVSPASVSEDGTTNLVFTFTRTGYLGSTLGVDYNIGGTATYNNDYAMTGGFTFNGLTGTVIFGAGSSTASVTFDPSADTTVEIDETVQLSLRPGPGYNVATAGDVTGTITNDDTDVTLSVTPASTNEDGTGTLLYTFTRTGVTTGALTVNFSVGGSAAFGTDYTQSNAATFTATTGTVTFAAGSNTAAITLTPTDDTTVENDETAILSLTSGTGYNVASPGAATGTILNDDTDVTVAVAPATVTEDGASDLVYTFTRTGVTTGVLTVNFSVGGVAAFGSDYTQSGAATFSPTSGTVTFAAGSSTAIVTLKPTTDSLVEANETTSLTLTAGAGYNIGAAASATGTINNDDAEITLALSPSAVAEDGAANLVYTFTRTGFTDTALTVNFTVGGTATLTSDYTASGAASFGVTTGMVTFLAGSSTATVTIDPVSDTNGETDETVALSLTNGSGYSIGAPSAATGTILNDDTAVSVAVTPSVLESSGTGLVYTFTRTGDTSTALTVNFSYDGTATIVSDYTQAGAATFASGLGTIVIPIGQSSAAITLAPQNDALVEGAETVRFTVQAGAGYGVSAGNVATGTIDDNDFAVIRFTNELETVTEGTPAKFVSVELLITADGSPGSGTLARAVSYNLATLATGTAGASDFSFSSPQTITYDPGQGSTTTNIAIGITDDRAVEGNETVDFRLNTLVDGTGGNVTFNGPIDGTLTIRDNDTATIGFVSATNATAENGTSQLQVGLAINATGTGLEALERPVSLTVNATGGTATGSGTDYTFAGPQTITFAAGAVAGTQTLTLTLNNDAIVEGNETIIFTANSLADGTNGQITQSGSPQHTLTITDNDTAALQFVAGTGSANENAGSHAFDLQLVITANGVPNTGTLGRAVDFAFTELTGDTATLHSDYTVASYAGSFGVGATSGTVTRTVTINDDTRVEGSETARFGLQVTSDGTGGQVSIGAQSTHTLTVSDNDTATLTLVTNGTTINESAGSLNVGFALVITANNIPNSGTLERPITIDLKDAGVGTTTVGSDYTFSSPQTVTFASGESSSVKNVSIGLVDDTRLEGNETMVFLADNFVDGTGGAASFNSTPAYTAVLQDNETAVIQLAADSALVSESAGSLPVGVTLVITANGTPNTGTLDRALTVSLTDVLPRTATPDGVDYTFISPQTITFEVGDASSTKTANLSVVNDALSEGNETLTIQLGTLNDPTGQASLGARQSTGITIVDNDIDLALTTTESANVIVAGGGTNLTYTVIVSNIGLTAATGIVIAEDLTFPQGVSIVSITPNLGTFDPALNPDGNWSIASLAPGSSATLTFVLAVDASAPEGTDVIGTHASVARSNENAINPANDVSTEATSIDRQIDLQISKTDNVTTVTPGGALSYAVNFANNGPSNATGVVVTEVLPAGTAFNATASTGTWMEGPAGTFKLLVGNLAAGANGSATFAVTATNPAPGGLDNVTNTAVISDDGTAGADANPGNNTATDIDALDALPDLQVSVVDDPVVTKRGDTVRYIVSFINVGNQDATNVFLTMTLPANTTFDLGQSSGSWTHIGGDVYRIDLGNLGVGATPEPVAFAVRVNSFLPAGYNVLSTVATLDDDHANGTDPVLANNTETENTPIYQGIYAVAPGVALPRKAGPPVVQVYDISSGLQTLTINAYEGTYRDSVRVALGDINGDGFDDIITSTRSGNGRVRVFDGVTGERFEGPFAELAAFPEVGAKGAFVASGDVTGDGHDDIIVGSGQGARGGGKVKVFDGVTGALVSSSEPFGARFRGGVRVAVGYVNADGIADVIASQGFGGNDVVVTNGSSTDQLLKLEIGGARYRGGVFVAAADLNNDGITDLIAGRDRGATVVETFNGVNGQLMDTITPFAPKYRFGARVAAADVNLDGIVDIIVGAGGRGNSEVKVFSGLDNSLLHSFQAFPMFPTGSLFVAGTSPVPGTPIVMPA